MPDQNVPDTRLLFHLSDIHFGLEDRRALDWVRDEIAQRRPDAVAITGDLTMRARHHEFRAACEWISRLDVPVTVGVGNHDMPYFNPLERFISPYRRFRAIKQVVEREIDLPGVAIVPLKTAARAQWRLNWSKGWITDDALSECLTAIDALPSGTRALVACHHPLVEVGTRGTALTRGGNKALAELAKRNVLAVLSGHVHDAFDLIRDTAEGAVRMIGAGTLSQRLRSTPPSFNELLFKDGMIEVTVRNLEHVPTPDMMIPDVPENAMPPRAAGEPVAPVGRVPAEDPPVH
ncbi:metallophosphoesterase family protein [Croceicoccus naphthovorans]|uniref:Metallophosphoesterase n=1 Tax=Croceicoccus naphthovorans TaxID=1348774 RepID=A0A0G3XJ57_9SPHN|nr:metallophosphoesterase [Croceicoccus naphthovorans]AKM11227.1 metallophosphoesterase [Croceicoccus naphthovorans]MBB3989870.1 3',5'-cyclic AMP phosphodiesterase CpdA [Croceicoccus naphthovorans]